MTQITCPRCSGTGELPKFRHIENGRCFLCEGAKVINVKDIAFEASGTCVCYQDNRNLTECWGEVVPINHRIERFSIVVNGGSFMPNGWDYVTEVTDSNRNELRALWSHAKRTGCECKAFHN